MPRAAGRRTGLSRGVLLPWTAASVGEARGLVRDDLARSDVPGETTDDVLLVVSELVSNALRHAHPLAHGCLRLFWVVRDEAVTVEVTDGGGRRQPRLQKASLTSTGGRGLAIVAALARDWGVEDGANGVTVWARVPLGSAA